MRGLKSLRKPSKTKPHDGSYAAYITGFVLSIVLTLIAYLSVVNAWFSGVGLVAFVSGLAVLQLLVQLIFFLHLSRESKPRWNLMSFLFAALVVLIVVIGSIWVMYNLNYNMMPQHDMDRHIMEEEGIYR